MAIAESVLHDLVPGRWRISDLSVQAGDVLPASLSRPAIGISQPDRAELKKLDVNTDLAGHDLDYERTQRWALAVYQNPAMVDGFIYMSRHLNTGQAAILGGIVVRSVRFGSRAA